MLGEPGDRVDVHATGVDSLKMRQVDLKVEGQAVPSDPATAGDADGGDLLGGAALPGQPDSRVAFVAVTREAEIGKEGDNRSL